MLVGVDGELARIRRDDAVPGEADEVLLRIEEMAEAKLVLTDALIAESRSGAARRRNVPRGGSRGRTQSTESQGVETPKPGPTMSSPPRSMIGDGGKNEGE